jgi:hypothetical protein
MSTLARKAAALATVPLLSLTLASCSNDKPPAPAASASPQYTSFEAIGDKIGCLSMANYDPETTDIQENKTCLLEHPVQQYGSITIYQYADVARRDKALKAGITQGQPFLVLSDTWALSGDVRDLRKAKAIMGAGELRTAEADPPGGSGSVGPGSDEPPADGGEAEVVPFGKAVTFDAEQVQVGKIYCNAVGQSGSDPDKQYSSCRLTRYEDSLDEVHRAAKGEEYFFVAFRWKNVGKAPVDPTPFGTLVTRDGLEFEQDESLSSDLTENARGNQDFDTDSKVNPGKSGRILLAYAIPKGTKVKGVHWGLEEFSDAPPLYQLEVR